MFGTVLRQTWACARKDLEIGLRFKLGFVLGTFTPALINLGLFTTVFFGFFKTGAPGLVDLNRDNFVAFSIVGALAATFFLNSFQSFQGRFGSEKYWQTIPAMLASPLSPWSLLLGIGLSDAIRLAGMVAVFLGAAYIFLPVGPSVVVVSFFLIALLYMMVSGLSMIRGALFLVNENYDTVIQYFVTATAYFSCFYYPASFIPSSLQVFAFINPVFFVVDSVRNLWLGLPVSPLYLAVAVVVSVICTIGGTYTFHRVWRNLDMTGY